MPSARNIRKDRRYLGKRMSLLAWKLGSRGRVVDEVVVLGIGVVGGSNGVYRRIKGGRNNKYTTIIAIQLYDIADIKNRGSNVVRSNMLGAGIHPGMNIQLRVINGQGVRRGKGSCRRCRGHPTNVWVGYPI